MNRKKLKTTLPLFITILFTQINYAQTVTIGKQVWMTKNLNVDKFRNGDRIPHAKTVEKWIEAHNNKQPAWCYYDNDPANGKKYGKLYNWYAVNDSRGLAPIGYHIPTDAEWTILKDFLGEGAGTKMKCTSGWKDNGICTDSSSFSALPGGYLGLIGTFISVGKVGYWWSSTESNMTQAWYHYLHYINGYTDRDFFDKRYGLSVRCLKD